MQHLKNLGSLPEGKTSLADRRSVDGSGSEIRTFTLDADTVLVTAYVLNHSSGTLDITLKGTTQAGEIVVIQFDQITADTPQLVVEKAPISLSNMRLEIEYSGTFEYEVWVRGVSGSVGTGQIVILGPTHWGVFQQNVGTTPVNIIASSLANQKGLVVRNNSASGVLYLAESMVKATTAVGYPLNPGESLAFDLEPGEEIYAVADVGTIDVRFAQVGS